MSESIKLHLVSFGQTFVVGFILDLGIALKQVPVDQLLSGHVLTSAFILGIVLGAGRSALKVAWEAFLPKVLGGKPKA